MLPSNHNKSTHSFFEQKAKELNISSASSKQDVINLYYETVNAIYDALLDADISSITDAFVREILEPDIRTIIKGIESQDEIISFRLAGVRTLLDGIYFHWSQFRAVRSPFGKTQIIIRIRRLLFEVIHNWPSPLLVEKKSYDVYISYNAQNRSSAEKISKLLREKGVKTWVDIWELKPGDDWIIEAKKALQKTSTVLVLIGSDGVSPRAQKEELEIIRARDGIRIVPVLLPGAKPNLVPNFLSDLVWLDFRAGLGHQELTKLESVAKLPANVDSGTFFSLLEQSDRDLINQPSDTLVIKGDASPDNFREVIKGETEQHTTEDEQAKRVLNANFSDPQSKYRILPLDRSLGFDKEYDLCVDVGLPWKDGKSLFKSANFPEEAVEGILSDDDKERGSFDIEVVFASEGFTPGLVTGMINLPTGSLEQSAPYIDGKLAEEPGWLTLRVCTPPRVPGQERDTFVHVHGRLSLYYKNNLLQSGGIQVCVSQEIGLELDEENSNSGEIDFVLSGDFEKVDENFATRWLSLGNDEKKANLPIAVNITLNDSKNGKNHFLVKYGSGEQSELKPIYFNYEPLATDPILTEFRKALFLCHKDVNDDHGKNIDRFKEDLARMAYQGHRLMKHAMATLPEDDETKDNEFNAVDWIVNLRKVLRKTAIIQVSRTNRANYAFPWGLLYDFRMVNPDHEKANFKYCKIVDEEWSQGKRSGTPSDHCKYENNPDYPEYNHWENNIVCPYGFWGLKHIIEQPISAQGLDDKARDIKSTIVSQNALLSIALTDKLEEEDLLNRQKHLKHLFSLGSVEIFPDKPARTLNDVIAMLNAPEIAYFLCHGERENGEPYLSVGTGDGPDYWLDPGFWSTFPEKFNLEKWKKNRPIIFINGCHTLDVRPSVVLDFLSSFKRLGANAVIGTEVSVLADMAMYIGDIILEKIANEDTIGDAIRDMRWNLVNRGNLLGLAYTPYGLSDLRIKREAKT